MFLEMIQSSWAAVPKPISADVLGNDPVLVGGGAETDQHAHGKGGVQELPPGRFPAEILLLDGHQHAGEDHEGRGTVPQVQRPGEVLDEVSSVDEHFSVACSRGQEIQPDEPEPDEGQGAGPFPAQEPGHGREQVGPSNQPEDAPPAGPEEAAAFGAVGDGEGEQQDDTRRPEPFAGPEPFGVRVPDEEEPHHHQQDEKPFPAAQPGRHAAFGIDAMLPSVLTMNTPITSRAKVRERMWPRVFSAGISFWKRHSMA